MRKRLYGHNNDAFGLFQGFGQFFRLGARAFFVIDAHHHAFNAAELLNGVL